MKYSERVSQIVTQARGKSSIGVASSARQQDRTASRHQYPNGLAGLVRAKAQSRNGENCI